MNKTTDEIKAVLENADRLYSQQDVERALDRMAAEIKQVIGDKDPLLVCVMTGGLVAASELFTRLDFPVQLDYLHATRYQGTRGTSELSWITPPSQSWSHRKSTAMTLR